MNLDPELFYVLPTPKVSVSRIVTIPSKTTQKPAKYVQLNDSEHEYLCRCVETIQSQRGDSALEQLLAESSGIWGSQLRKYSTLGEVLRGVQEKLNRKHPYVRGRFGEDLSVKQMTAINTILSKLAVETISIPDEED